MCVHVCVFLLFFFPFSERVHLVHSFALVYVKTSSVDLYQKPKTLQSVLVSLVLRLDESNKIDKSFFKKRKKISQLIWNSVSRVSNSGQKCLFFLILKNSLKIGFIVGCCFCVFFFIRVFFFFCIFSNCFLVVAAVVLVAKFPYIIGRGCPGLVLQYWGLWE